MLKVEEARRELVVHPLVDLLGLSYVQERGSSYRLCVAALVRPRGKKAPIR